MSVFAYLTSNKHNSSAWLRDRLTADSIQAKRILSPESFSTAELVAPEEFDPVLQFHCRTTTPEPPIQRRRTLPANPEKWDQE